MNGNESSALLPKPQHILAIVQERMRERNFTIHKLAKRLALQGINRATVYNFCTGNDDRAVKLDTLAAILAELDLAIVAKEASK